MLKQISRFIVASSFLLAIAPSHAVLYSFEEITNNSPINVASQLSVDVTGAGSTVFFQFFNNVGLASSITDIYFDNTSNLLALPMVITDSGAGVAFSTPATPGSLPGQNDAGFVTTAGFSADSDAPASSNGVNTSTEWVKLQFGTTVGNTFDDVIAAMNAGTFRVGLHVQALSDDESESYVTMIPEPEIYAMMGLGLGLMGWVARRRKQQAA